MKIILSLSYNPNIKTICIQTIYLIYITITIIQNYRKQILNFNKSTNINKFHSHLVYFKTQDHYACLGIDFSWEDSICQNLGNLSLPKLKKSLLAT